MKDLATITKDYNDLVDFRKRHFKEGEDSKYKNFKKLCPLDYLAPMSDRSLCPKCFKHSVVANLNELICGTCNFILFRIIIDSTQLESVYDDNTHNATVTELDLFYMENWTSELKNIFKKSEKLYILNMIESITFKMNSLLDRC